MTSYSAHRIAIIGGGIIGLACAWALVRRGARVTICDAGEVEASASWAAAGMLGPTYESLESPNAHARLGALCHEGARIWHDFARDLEADSDISIGYNAGPSIAVSASVAGLEGINHLEGAIPAQELARLEPGLSGGLAGGFWLEGDGWVDNRQTVHALKIVLANAGAEFVTRKMDAEDAALNDFDSVLFTVNAGLGLPIKPVKGVMLAFARQDVPLERVVRCGAEYAVPRGDLTLVGATVGDIDDPRGFLISRASRFLRGIRETRLVDQWSGYRPMTPDLAPCLGALPGKRRFVASGHYRNGILLAPLTGEMMAQLILEGTKPKIVGSFGPERFNVTT